MGSKRVTSQDVARHAGVSRTTVSFVLNNVAGMQISDETRQRVTAAAQALGYVPDAAAQALASGHSGTIGLLLARRSDVIGSDLFLTQMMHVLVREVNRQGMRLLLEVVENYENQESFLRLVRSNSLDGVLYSGPRLDDSALRSLVSHGVPTVLMGALPGSPYCFVDVNNRSAAQTAVEHLLRLGHRRIACLTNAPAAYAASSDRLCGYQDALSAAGVPVDQNLIRYGDFDAESGYMQMQALLRQQPRPTAVFVASDVVAIGAIKAIHEAGLSIPQQMAVVGFDDVPVAKYFEPALTTMHLPIAELAARACDMLVHFIQGKPPEQTQILLEAHLVVRDSCGAAGCAIADPSQEGV